MAETKKQLTERITVCGIVQGVGFRPTVYRLAKQHGIKGTVRNIGGAVEITATADRLMLDAFFADLQTIRIAGCVITSCERHEVDFCLFDDFVIVDSKKDEQQIALAPDLPVCDDCAKELYEPINRRFGNPFISCMSCGPRYTVIEELPYDRENTTMRDFALCEPCHGEYTSPEDRRFHAQTISCNDCGPYLMLDALTRQAALDEAVNRINKGGIVAVKGIGGYHFACSPFLENAVVNLRKLKGREEKPFAVMFPNADSISAYCEISSEEKDLLLSPARPIVLLYDKQYGLAPSVGGGSMYCGAFLPYTPLQILLSAQCGPLVMTSANLSDRPIIRENGEMLAFASPYLDGVLRHDRRIVRSVDDSVAKVIDGAPQLIRRSRGYVPYPVMLSRKSPQLFAAGGDLKAAFCLTKNGNAVVSQPFGDLAEVSVSLEYEKAYDDLCRLLHCTPEAAMFDSHPNYMSSKFAKALGIPSIPVQHHHAHAASVMAEHHLEKPCIGVAFDGTGYGTDGTIWGGEFLLCDGAEFTREAHLAYTPILGGDTSMKDAKKTETCFLIHAGLSQYITDVRTETIRAAIGQRVNTVLSSSMGRLFDAVSSLLQIQTVNRYEGECAALLEKEALLALRKGLKSEIAPFSFTETESGLAIETKDLFRWFCENKGKRTPCELALGFHHTVAQMVLQTCKLIRDKSNVKTVVLSGGVFQNSVLTKETLLHLRKNEFKVYCNHAVPPNDGGISLGQTYIGLQKIK